MRLSRLTFVLGIIVAVGGLLLPDMKVWIYGYSMEGATWWAAVAGVALMFLASIISLFGL